MGSNCYATSHTNLLGNRKVWCPRLLSRYCIEHISSMKLVFIIYDIASVASRAGKGSSVQCAAVYYLRVFEAQNPVESLSRKSRDVLSRAYRYIMPSFDAKLLNVRSRLGSPGIGRSSAVCTVDHNRGIHTYAREHWDYIYIGTLYSGPGTAIYYA